MNIVRTFLSITLIAAVATTANADDQIFVRGTAKAIRGTIGKMTKDFLEIKPRSGAAKKIPADEINRVRFNAEPPELNRTRSAEESGLLDRALKDYNGVVGSLKGGAKKDTEFLIARTKCRMAIADPTKGDSALKAMQAALAKNANGYRHYECLVRLGRVQMANADFGGAKLRFEALGKSTMKSHQMAARVATGQVLLAQDNPAEAQSNFDAVVGMKAGTEAETASRYEAVLGKARCQQLQSNFDGAIKSLEEIVDNTKPEEAAELHARAFLQKGDCYRDQQKTKQAVMAYLHVDLIYDRAKGAHAESLFQLSQLWPQAGHPDRGSEAGSRLKKLYPNNPWTKKLAGG